MTESSILWGTTGGVGDGIGTGYTAAQLFQLFRALFAHTANLGGVVPDSDNELAVTGTATPVAVASGAAIVYGIPYFNTASLNVTIPTPAALTRIDRIVLRADWVTQTVRSARIAGVEGGSAPAMTQSAGTTWDVPLATVSITTGGVITVTDGREWLGIVGDGAIDGAKIANYAVNPRTHISGTNGIVVDPQNGDARGDDAVDLQTVRNTAAQVASGQYAVIGGGNGNAASAVGAIVNGGQLNAASGNFSIVNGGQVNAASGLHSAIGGGNSNTASGDKSAVVGGVSALANKYGQEAFASGGFSVGGDAQRSIFVLRGSTGNNTPTEIFLDGASARMTIASDSTWAFRAFIVARRSDADNESAGYEVTGVIDNNAGTTALVAAVTKTPLAEDNAAWDIAFTADNTNDALVLTVTGENAKTIKWVATVWTTEVIG